MNLIKKKVPLGITFNYGVKNNELTQIPNFLTEKFLKKITEKSKMISFSLILLNTISKSSKLNWDQH